MKKNQNESVTYFLFILYITTLLLHHIIFVMLLRCNIRDAVKGSKYFFFAIFIRKSIQNQIKEKPYRENARHNCSDN
jgi:uncharacterized membrane protein